MKNILEPKKNFESFIKSKEKISAKNLDDFFAALEPIKTKEIFGNWRGGHFTTGNKLEWLLKDYIFLKWRGKKILSQSKIKAFMVSFLGINFNLPFCDATLDELDFRGKKSAAIIYNNFPIVDYFRKIDENTIMGIMALKGKAQTYFYLKRL